MEVQGFFWGLIQGFREVLRGYRGLAWFCVGPGTLLVFMTPTAQT